MIALCCEFLGQKTLATAQVKNGLSPSHQVANKVMAGKTALLERIMSDVFSKFGVDSNALDRAFIVSDGPYYILGILHAIHITNFITIVSGNRDFFDV